MIAECAYKYPENYSQKMLSYFEDFITLCSALHFAYWWQQKSYLPELCEELSAKATCQSCVKNYLPKLPDDYLSEHCNNIFYELL
jgi:hypothetical protein